MRLSHPLIIGAGPAGCAAAIALGRGGTRCTLIDRDEEVGDPLCGGFLSWRTAEQLEALDVNIDALGAHRISRLRLFAGTRSSEVALPRAAFGLSRLALDSEMRRMAIANGAQFSVDTIRGVDSGKAIGSQREWNAPAIFLASGKHDIRGQSRPRTAKDTTLGIRLRLPATPKRTSLIGDAIELHLIDGGYVGIVLQEGGSANICLAVRKSALARAGGSPDGLFAQLADQHPAMAERLGDDLRDARTDTIGAVPYGWICSDTAPGLFRLGDQAAVIPSLAGEGISIALASAQAAARSHSANRSSQDYQAEFATRVRRPVRLASTLWHTAETHLGARAAIALSRMAPGLIATLAQGARIPPVA
ncbi:NAD(P)/FAD-dependent oxidoreductase [Erythrobacter alti]|uniref:NAD(P)/FAD-dependent oxidoreductase n=1 Tax=Erythrobacter alti TaxID=1896145 RepID=UPI0030F44957